MMQWYQAPKRWSMSTENRMLHTAPSRQGDREAKVKHRPLNKFPRLQGYPTWSSSCYLDESHTMEQPEQTFSSNNACRCSSPRTSLQSTFKKKYQKWFLQNWMSKKMKYRNPTKDVSFCWTQKGCVSCLKSRTCVSFVSIPVVSRPQSPTLREAGNPGWR